MFSGPGAAGTRTALCNRALGPLVLAYKPHGWRQSPARADPAKMTNRPQHRRCALRAARCAGDSAPIGGSCGSHPRRLVRGSAKATTLLTSRFSFNNRHLYSGGASLKPSPPSTRAEIGQTMSWTIPRATPRPIRPGPTVQKNPEGLACRWTNSQVADAHVCNQREATLAGHGCPSFSHTSMALRNAWWK